MKLLVVGLNYAPEQVGIGPYTAGLCEWLAGCGHNVEVVAGEPYYPEWRRRDGVSGPSARRVENGVGVRRCRHYIPSQPSGLKRLAHLFSFSLSALGPACAAARRQRPDAVFTVAPSLMSVPVAWLAAKLAGAKLWVHVQDFEAEAAFVTGLLKPGLTARLAQWLERRLLGLGRCVSAISPQMVARLQAKGIAAERSYELRNWANDSFKPDMTEAARYREEWNIGARHVALYSGNIANKQGIELVVETARLLTAREDLVFVICGEGPSRMRLEEQCAGQTNVQLHGLQPAGRMGGLLAMASVHLLPQIPGAADLVLPSKLTNMLLSGRPVVTTASEGTGLAAEVEGCGLVTEPGDAVKFAKAIERLLDDPALAESLGAGAAARARSHWQRDAILRRFEARLVALASAA
ncbi:MAG: WcaI family glycosyltransferase [Novosphingobium sp.]